MKKIILLILFFVTNFTFACINGRVLRDGSLIYPINHDPNVRYVAKGHKFVNKYFLLKYYVNLKKQYLKTKNIDYLSDIGIILILLKENDKAINLYKKIEKIKPDRYDTAANLGTAYELIGDNKNALYWISKSVKLNRYSHENSEWIHVNILKIKNSNLKNINSKNLINTDFGNQNIPVYKGTKKISHLGYELVFQLNERLSFIKTKDPIMARLLFDLGNINFIMKDYNIAIKNYENAIKYGFNENLIHKRLKLAKSKI